ncbi:DUF5753 domain-containing protein [Haloactinospora alba]|uniref:DUF5753 domain-containing protein n=1 Tax=Haloactinospora alba TaxID=405555 RepID=UPI0011503C75|nr:DUF5753 domain-containing protein [Haloactinospora alba]
MVRYYQALTFPAYLQTEAYARSLIRYGAPWLTPDEVPERAAERAAYGEKLTGSRTPVLWTVVDETVLWRRYGSTAIMREQLAHIVNLVDRERLTIQLVPAQSHRHPGNSGSFTIITGEGPEVVYAEIVNKGQTITAASEVARYRLLFGSLQGTALGPDETLTVLRNELKRIDDEQG